MGTIQSHDAYTIWEKRYFDAHIWLSLMSSIPLFLLAAYLYLNKKFKGYNYQLIAAASAAQAFCYYNTFFVQWLVANLIFIVGYDSKIWVWQWELSRRDYQKWDWLLPVVRRYIIWE